MVMVMVMVVLIGWLVVKLIRWLVGGFSGRQSAKATYVNSQSTPQRLSLIPLKRQGLLELIIRICQC